MQVPVLTYPILLPSPIPDSLEITYYIATQYPSLIPDNHKAQIIELLKELHSINYFSLSFGSRPASADAQKAAVEQKLAQTGISEKYRKALEYKLTMYATWTSLCRRPIAKMKNFSVQNEKVNGVTAAEIETQINHAKTFLEKIAKLYEPSKGQWLWGRTSPTVLDVHVAVFLVRLHDVGRAVLVPEKLVPFYEVVMEMREWSDVYQGRSTMFGVVRTKESL